MSKEALGMHRGTLQVYISHEILDILQNYEPENEESVTALASLRDGLIIS